MKKRKIRQRILVTLGVMLVCVYLVNLLIPSKNLVGIKTKASSVFLPSKQTIQDNFELEDSSTEDKARTKQLKKIYKVLHKVGSFGNTDFSANGIDFDEWKEQMEENTGAVEGYEWLEGGSVITQHDSANDFYSIVQKEDGDIIESFHTLDDARKKKIQSLDWKKNAYGIYAMKSKKRYLGGTEQLSLKDSKFINALEQEGYKGIKEWVTKLEEDKTGIPIQIDGKTEIFHDTKDYHTFESNGVMFSYNYENFMMAFDIDESNQVVKATKELLVNANHQIQVAEYMPGKSYTQIGLKTNVLSDYSNIEVKVIKKKGKIVQVTLKMPESWDVGTEKIKYGFYDKDKVWMEAFLIEMGATKEEAKKWTDTFSTKQENRTGTIGSCRYTIKHEKDLTDASAVCKVMIEK